MRQINQVFAELGRRGEAALIPYLTAGFPSPAETPVLVRALAEGGADLIELGVPFSDPVADGPVIQMASQVALSQGMTLARTIDLVKATRREGVGCPILLMSYFNVLLSYGIPRLLRDAPEAGVDGLIIPDLPPEEAVTWANELHAAGLSLIQFVAPTTSEDRLKLIAGQANGFLYVISTTGVTGAREHLATELEGCIARTRRVTGTPLAVGFGISNPEHVAQVSKLADGAIVGSALIELLQRTTSEKRADELRSFTRRLKAATLRCTLTEE